jgi:hypothetical protein
VIRPGAANPRFQATPPSNVAPTQQGPTVLRGGNAPQPQGVPQGQGVDLRFRVQMGNQPVVPQSRLVTPQIQPVQPRVVTPPAPQNRAVEQDRRSPNGG